MKRGARSHLLWIGLALWSAGAFASPGDGPGNGNDPLETFFEWARGVAIKMTQAVNVSSLDDKRVQEWLTESTRKALAEDIAASPHDWDKRRGRGDEVCARTEPTTKAVVYFADASCRKSMPILGDQNMAVSNLRKMLQGEKEVDRSISEYLLREAMFAVTTILHESVHHLRHSTHPLSDSENQEEENFARAVSLEIYQAKVASEPVLAKAGKDSQSLFSTHFFTPGEYWSQNYYWHDPTKIEVMPGFNEFTISDTGYRSLDSRVWTGPERLELVPNETGDRYSASAEVTDIKTGCRWRYQLQLSPIGGAFYAKELFPTEVVKTNYGCELKQYYWKYHDRPYRFLTENRNKVYEYGLERETDPYKRDEISFFLAASKNDVTTIQRLLPEINPNFKDWEGMTPIMVAAYADAGEAVKALVDVSNLDEQDIDHTSVFRWSLIGNGKVKKGAAMEALLFHEPLHQEWAYDGLTTAAAYGNLALVKRILSTFKVNEYGRDRALETASYYVKAKPDENADAIFRTLLESGVSAGGIAKAFPALLGAPRFDLADEVLATGWNLDTPDPQYGGLALTIAGLEKDLRAVQYLIAHHANVNLGDKYGRTPLIRCAESIGDTNPVPVMVALLDAKANPNLTNKEGSTMLDEIASQLYRETNRYQDVNKLVDDPKVSFHYRIYQWLVKRGAKLHKQSPPPDVAPGQRPR